MTYLAVFDGEQAGWHLDRQALLAGLARDWADVVPRVGDSEVRDVSWTVTTDGSIFEAYSHSDGTCLYLDGDLETAARFAIWYRGLVPEQIELTFCDDEYTFAIPVTGDVTVEDLIASVE